MDRRAQNFGAKEHAMSGLQRSRRYFFRTWLRVAVLVPFAGLARADEAKHPNTKWYLEAERMRKLAESRGDQSYGAVVVANGAILGYGPSRVVIDRDPDAHAERVAIKEATNARGTASLSGAILYSTSRPCALCERAAAAAGIARMYFGPDTRDAGTPRSNV
jgi:tRNA(Arg) A34 adenosine deaminase TadA